MIEVGKQRRLPPPALRRSRHPGAGGRAGSQRRRRRHPAGGDRRSTEMFGRRAAQALVTTGRRADLLVGNNVLAQAPDLDDFVGGLAARPGPRRRPDARVPAPPSAPRGEPVRHDLSRALLVLLAGHRRADPTGSRPGGVRRRGVPDTRRVPPRARAAGDNRPARHEPARGPSDRRGAESRAAHPRAYGRFQEQVRDTKEALLASSSSAPGGPASASPATARLGRATRSSTTAGSARTSSSTRWTAIRTSRGSILPGSRIPIHAPDHVRATRPDYLLILPWNLREEIKAQMADIRAWGGQFVVPIPRVAVHP